MSKQVARFVRGHQCLQLRHYLRNVPQQRTCLESVQDQSQQSRDQFHTGATILQPSNINSSRSFRKQTFSVSSVPAPSKMKRLAPIILCHPLLYGSDLLMVKFFSRQLHKLRQRTMHILSLSGNAASGATVVKMYAPNAQACIVPSSLTCFGDVPTESPKVRIAT